MLNACHFIGRLTKDPEQREGIGGNTFVKATIAVKRRVRPVEGKDATFITLAAYGQTGHYLFENGHKGRLVCVSGRMESRQFTTDNGEEREVLELICESVSILDRPRDEDL